jgi:2-oxoglutarate dehydrogenase E2 component (dihydrolipoamide succinyltransferase)
MNVKVIAPLIGEGVDELSVVAWKKKLGDSVVEGEALVELESDKVVTEVESPASGTLAEVLAAEGDKVAVGAALAVIASGEAGAAVSSAAVPAAVAEQAAAAEPATVAPSGPELRPHSVLRKRIAERMIASQLTSAHVLTVTEVDMSAVVAHRAANKEAFAKEGVKLTLSAYFVRALAAALRRFPEMNASFTEEGMLLHPDVNVGLAVSLGDGGLIVPVVKKADSLGLIETAKRIDDLAEAARAGKLGNDDVKGGTFTLTNYGTTGSLIAAPIINQPQIGILGAGSLQKRPVIVTNAESVDEIAIRPMVYLSLVFDHRALDGEAASRFLRGVKEGLESWAEEGR